METPAPMFVRSIFRAGGSFFCQSAKTMISRVQPRLERPSLEIHQNSAFTRVSRGSSLSEDSSLADVIHSDKVPRSRPHRKSSSLSADFKRMMKEIFGVGGKNGRIGGVGGKHEGG